MKYYNLIGAGMLLLLTACASGNAPTSAATVTNATTLAAIEQNLPAGVTVGTATQSQLDKAVRKTVRADPALTGTVVKAVSEAAPGRNRMAKKALSSAMAPYARKSGNGRTGH